MSFYELNNNQRRVFIDTAQIYEAYRDILKKEHAYKGGMHWKKAKDREYLFKTRDRYGYGKSLGVRSPETEKILAGFKKNKQKIKGLKASLLERLKEQSRLSKAMMIQRAPKILIRIVQLLDQHQLMGRNLFVVGTNALYAYEAAAGVFLDRPIMATNDMDILWDIKAKLEITVDPDMDKNGLLGILKKADRSFELPHKGSFRAINREGYIIDLIKAQPKQLMKIEMDQIGKEGDLRAAEVRNLHWLVSSPKMQQIVIGEDGYPAMLAVPDPRAFALHKLWLSDQPDREPIKKNRDRDQAEAVIELINRYLPQYPFRNSELKMFPEAVIQKAQEVINKNMMEEI